MAGSTEEISYSYIGNIDPTAHPHAYSDSNNPEEGSARVEFDLELFDKDPKKAIELLTKMSDKELLEFVPKDPETGKPAQLKGVDDEIIAAREARLVYVYRMMVRGATNVDISKAIGVSPARVVRLKREVQERIRAQIGRIDFGLYAAETMGFYREAKFMAMSIAGSQNSKASERMYALQTALKTQKDEQDFLAKCGVFKHVDTENDLLTGLTKQDSSEEDDIGSMLSDLARALKDDAAVISHGQAQEAGYDEVSE